MSSKMATVVGPTVVGSIVKTTHNCFMRTASFLMSSTKKVVSGKPCAKSAALNALAAGFSSGSSALSGDADQAALNEYRAKLAQLDKDQTDAEKVSRRAVPARDRAARHQQTLQTLTRLP